MSAGGSMILSHGGVTITVEWERERGQLPVASFVTACDALQSLWVAVSGTHGVNLPASALTYSVRDTDAGEE